MRNEWRISFSCALSLSYHLLSGKCNLLFYFLRSRSLLLSSISLKSARPFVFLVVSFAFKWILPLSNYFMLTVDVIYSSKIWDERCQERLRERERVYERKRGTTNDTGIASWKYPYSKEMRRIVLQRRRERTKKCAFSVSQNCERAFATLSFFSFIHSTIFFQQFGSQWWSDSGTEGERKEKGNTHVHISICNRNSTAPSLSRCVHFIYSAIVNIVIVNYFTFSQSFVWRSDIIFSFWLVCVADCLRNFILLRCYV